MEPNVPPALPFAVEEFRARQARVRAELERRGIDVLFVTSPANLLYLTGYVASWYPPRLPVGAAITRADTDVVFFDGAATSTTSARPRSTRTRSCSSTATARR
jgi:Xaa-Pro aminopeptidase